MSTTSARPGDTVDVTISGAAFMGFLLQVSFYNKNAVFCREVILSKHLKGQLGPCVGHVTFLDQRRSVGASL